MISITNNKLGFALFLAAEYESTLSHSGDQRQVWLDRSDLEIAEYLCPNMIHDDDDPELAEIMENVQDWTEIEEEFLTSEFMGYCASYFKLVREGKLKCVAAMQEVDYDADTGCLISLDFMLNFHESLSKAENPVVWRHGPFLAIVDKPTELVEVLA